jgi:DNA-binding transcriptional ArsR family regulator
MDDRTLRRIGDILKDRNIILKGADAATSRGFTQVPNFLLRAPHLSPGDRLSFAVLLSYAWHNDPCFPGQATLAKDLGLSDRSVRTHLKSLEAQGLLEIRRRGLGKTNIYALNLKCSGVLATSDRKKSSGLQRKETLRRLNGLQILHGYGMRHQRP